MANIARLRELLKNVVPYIPPRQLRMRAFTGPHKALPNGCGTVACIAGWAGVHPQFIAQGYVLSERLHIAFWGNTRQHIPLFEGEEMANAVNAFFGTDKEEFNHIFGEEQKNDPVLAACRIIDVIEANTP